MAHFVKLDDDNIVVDKVVVNNDVILDDSGNEQESLGIQFLRDLYNDQSATWVQTSYNDNFRHKFADIQDKYHADIDQCIAFHGFEHRPTIVLNYRRNRK